MLRPIRGTVAANHAENLHWLYTATFVAMLLLVPVFGLLVAKLRRGLFVPGIYLFFISNLIFFTFAFKGDATGDWIQYSFYVWLSVFNLFVVSIFWSFMVDIFQPDQAQRLFGSIMAGGSLGAILGPLLTANLVAQIGSRGVMTMAVFLPADGDCPGDCFGAVRASKTPTAACRHHWRQHLGGCGTCI